MSDLSRQSDRILTDARSVRDDNRAGGRHRRTIGREAGRLRQRHLGKKIRNIAIAAFVIWVGAGIAGTLFNGIGFMGVMALIVATCVAVALFSSFPKMKVPQRAQLNQGDARALVGKTELWLDSQRRTLPPPAADMVGLIGMQLDDLGVQLQHVDQAHPTVREVRSLVGETLPEMIDSYRRIPQHLRAEKRAGEAPDEQLTAGLGKVSAEIDRITRHLAEGSLDDLAVRTRYLDYKYGTDGAIASPSPDIMKDPA